LAVALLLPVVAYTQINRGQLLMPDPIATPGAINPDVTQDNIDQTICVRGWTATIRPPASYTNRLKLEQMKAMNLPGSPRDYEEDHLISLEIGGNPTDPENLWPEPWDGTFGAHAKDRLENTLRKLVCSRRLTLNTAQAAIRTNWITAYQQYVSFTAE
jgi:hypothetical protein